MLLNILKHQRLSILEAPQKALSNNPPHGREEGSSEGQKLRLTARDCTANNYKVPTRARISLLQREAQWELCLTVKLLI